MSRETGREGTEASEAWREAGRDMVVESGGAPRRRRAGQLGQLALGLVLAFGLSLADAVHSEGVSRSKLERWIS